MFTIGTRGLDYGAPSGASLSHEWDKANKAASEEAYMWNNRVTNHLSCEGALREMPGPVLLAVDLPEF